MATHSDLIIQLIAETKEQIRNSSAIALDFDGVCKLFTEHKHQIMFTLLYLHASKFQRVPMEEYRKAYGYINFHSEKYAGKARFLCVNALANFLSEKGYECRMPSLDASISAIEAKNVKINANSLKKYAEKEDVRRILAWSEEVDLRLTQLTEIGLTPGIKENIFDVFSGRLDFYLVSTATESSFRPSLEKEGVDFINRYFGQETAGKTEALTALANSGYENVFMFGDSIEDSRASYAAMKETPAGVNLIFAPIIPGREEFCFKQGRQVIEKTIKGDVSAARAIAAEIEKEFQNNMAGSQWKVN